MLSRMYTTTVVARSIRASNAHRYMATAKGTSPVPPKAQGTGATAAKSNMPPIQGPASPKTTSPATPTPSSKGSVSPDAPQTMYSFGTRASNAHFDKARANLPLRFYNKPGVLASRLYVAAEKAGKGEVDKVGTALTSLSNEFKAHPKLLSFLVNAAKTPQQKSVLLKSLAKSLNLPPTLSQFLDYMSTTRTTKDLTKVMSSFENLVNARDKVVDVTITLAQEDQPRPDVKEIAKVLNYSDDTKVRLKVVVDPSIEGGAILSSKDRLLDRSFRRATSAFREKLEAEAQKKRAQKRQEFLKELAQFPDSIHP